MRKANKKIGFTLAEVMVVLLVLTILFAAFAPLITKRRRNSADRQEVWMWSSRNYMAGPMDIYYKPVNDSYDGGIFIGTTPDSENDLLTNFAPLAKFTIRSGYVLNDNSIQRQLQLRYGRNDFDDPGHLAATFLADNTNMLFGADFPELETKKNDSSYPKENISFGFGALNSIKDYNKDRSIVQENNTAFGSDALNMVNEGAKDNTSIGASSGNINFSGSQNTFIGYYAGGKATNSANTLIGYNSQVKGGYFNTLVGASTGYADSCPTCTGSRAYKYNTALGYKALSSILDGTYNVAIGTGALEKLEDGHYNVAIGYKACSGITNQSYKTCLGALSGPANLSPVNMELGFNDQDDTPRTYIGKNPNLDDDGNWSLNGNYGGDAVLEIHNSKGSPNKRLNNNPYVTSNATTIINGNLIVKGKTFFTIGDILYPFYYQNNIFGTNPSVNCASNQLTYQFSNLGNCATLAPITEVTSDRRLKNITSRNTNGLDKIKQLKVYNFVFKDDVNKEKHVGVIAQDLQKIFPNSVFANSNGYLQIRTDEIFYSAINAIKELNKRISALIKRTDKLDKQITSLENNNKELQKQIDLISSKIEKLKK